MRASGPRLVPLLGALSCAAHPQGLGRRAALSLGGVAQLGERLLCKQEVIGSIPFTSTISRRLMVPRQR